MRRHHLLLRTRAKRPRNRSAANKYDEFPSPHGFAHAEAHVGYEKNITFWIEICIGRYTQVGRLYVRFGS